MNSWISIPTNSDFSLHNIPFGIIQNGQLSPRVATIIGEKVIDLAALAEMGCFDDLNIDKKVFHQTFLNDFIALGKAKTSAVRARIIELFQAENTQLQNAENQSFLISASEVENLMPIYIRDYTDFYSSIEHATNVGIMFRGVENALMPNWKHLPVGYHGRASSIVVSGTNLHRPKGQTRPDDNLPPVFGASKQVDFELEMGFIVGKSTDLGYSVSTNEAENYIFGLFILNDWSARDIQKWEYIPLGPFLAKNFGSSVSPWVVTMEALEPFRVPTPTQTPEVLPYLQTENGQNVDIELEVLIETEKGIATKISHSNTKYLYWSMAQQLAHHTVNGCNLNVGDMMASGTISGPTPDSYGSMLELAWKGTKPLQMEDGTERKFILDNDSVIMRAYSQKGDIRVGFGEVRTKILPAK
jgi:fumarylacetoacetase